MMIQRKPLILAIAMLSLATTVQAQVGNDDLAQRMAQLESEMASLNGRLHFPSGRGQLVSGYEWTNLRVFGADRFAAADDLTTNQDIFEAERVLQYRDHETGNRYWIGYENSNQTGVRVRYWDLSSGAKETTVASPGDATILSGIDGRVDLQTLDVEVTQRAAFRNWSLLGSAGVRRGKVNTRSFMAIADGGLPFDNFLDHEQLFTGYGPTLSLEAKTSVLKTKRLSLYGNIRSSLLFSSKAKERFRIADDLNEVALREDFEGQTNMVLPVIESQIGLEWLQPTDYGNIFVRAGVEVQAWFGVGDNGAELLEFQENNLEDGRFLRPNNILGLVGYTASVGMDY